MQKIFFLLLLVGNLLAFDTAAAQSPGANSPAPAPNTSLGASTSPKNTSVDKQVQKSDNTEACVEFKGDTAKNFEGKTSYEVCLEGGYAVKLNESILGKKSIAANTGMGLVKEYISIIYRFAFAIISVVCIFVIILGGLRMTLSGVDDSGVSEGKELIVKAILSLILVLTAHLILRTINPGFFRVGSPTDTNTNQCATQEEAVEQCKKSGKSNCLNEEEKLSQCKKGLYQATGKDKGKTCSDEKGHIGTIDENGKCIAEPVDEFSDPVTVNDEKKTCTVLPGGNNNTECQSKHYCKGPGVGQPGICTPIP